MFLLLVLLFMCFCLFPDSTSKVISKNESDQLGKQCGRRLAYKDFGIKVWRGQLASVGQFPWAANFFGVAVCGGTLITRRHVLTAGHCVIGKECYGRPGPPKAFIVFLGHLSKFHGYQFKVHAVKYPKHYGKGASEEFECFETGGDIAVLELDRDVPEQLLKTGLVGFACLPSYKEQYDDTDLIAHGWGLTVYTQPEDKLVWTTLKKLFYQTCKRNWKNSGVNIADDYICAKEINTSVCGGDSGSALLQRHDHKLKVMGVVSGGEECANMTIGQEYDGGLYTDVRKHLKWLCAVTGACYSLN